MYKSYSYNDMPKAVNTNAPPVQPVKKELPKNDVIEKKLPSKQNGFTLGRLQSDDLILLIIIIALILNDCNDKLLLLALAYVFFADYLDGKVL